MAKRGTKFLLSGDLFNDVFGKPNRLNDVNKTYMFTGRRSDPETALYYYRARYYDTLTGRFLQTDPVGYTVGLNLYTYCGNNSVNYCDPHGLLQFLVGGSVSGGAGWGGTEGMQLVIGTDGIGVYWHGGVGGHGGIDYSTTVDISVLSGNSADLNGISVSTGGAGQVPSGIGGGLEVNIGQASGGTVSINIPFLSGGISPGNLHAYVEYGCYIPLTEAIPSLEEIAEYWTAAAGNVYDYLYDVGYKSGMNSYNTNYWKDIASSIYDYLYDIGYESGMGSKKGSE